MSDEPIKSYDEIVEISMQLERELNVANAYISRLLSAGNHMADVSTDRRRLLWLDAVNSRKDV